MEQSFKRPDIVLIVLDCARAIDLPGGSDPVSDLPALERLFARSHRFSHAVAVSPWTYPSHSSILSGKYPWEIGVLSEGKIGVLTSEQTILGLLHTNGYRTGLFSANPIVSPQFGLAKDVNYAAWASWPDIYVRRNGTARPHHIQGDGLNGHSETGSAHWTTASRHLEYLPLFLMRRPQVFAEVSRFVQKLEDPAAPTSFAVSSWIEPSLDRWIRCLPERTPFSALINLMDGHEPYLSGSTGESNNGLGAGWLRALPRQDRIAWLLGEWVPSSEDLLRLRAGYRKAMQALDDRVARILQVLKDTSRLERSIVIVTSDHGQAFGEHGMLLHGQGVTEQILRVPLWVAYPHDGSPGVDCPQWASLVDIPSTMAKAAGIPVPEAFRGVALQDLAADPAERQVFALSQGVLGRRRKWLTPQMRENLDRTLVAGYSGNRKVVWALPQSRPRVYDIEADPQESTDMFRPGITERDGLVESTRQVIERVSGLAPYTTDSVLRRLELWGYG